MRAIVVLGLLGGMLAGCSADWNPVSTAHHIPAGQNETTRLAGTAHLARKLSTVAGLPDRGSLLAYDSRQPIRRGASIWHPVQLSEEHALRAIADGTMVLNAPNGEPIRLQYVRHIEHPDGNWTWVGRPAGAGLGTEAMLTFGEKAVFGSIPNGKQAPLQITTAAGRTWLVETDERMLADMEGSKARTEPSDALVTPVASRATGVTPVSAQRTASASAPLAADAPVPAAIAPVAGATAVVDLVIGYTTTFAAGLGGQSQAATRLNFIVDVANQAYANSEVPGRVRLVHSVEVNYPDATLNRTALFDLSGVQCTDATGPGQLHLPNGDVNCTPVSVPTALQPLLAAREQYHADLVSLVRTFQDPQQQSCGVAWLLGGGQQPIIAASAAFGLSVVSDSSGTQNCRSETLAHELGHNMGLAHDRQAAAGTDDTNSDGNLLDPEEYGRFPYSFGESTAAASGNFYTVMSIRQGSQTGYRVFSNPRITACGGFACGVADQEDNARTLEQTMPVIAAFRTAVVPKDFNADGQSDVLWRNITTGQDAIWLSGRLSTPQTVTGVTDQAWKVAGVGDFNGDSKADILWRNSTDGRNAIWLSANSATQQGINGVSAQAWTIVGVGDFNGDGKSDILWRNISTGQNAIWLSGNFNTPQTVTSVTDLTWKVVGVGDFNADGKSDILWRNTSDGRDAIWLSAVSTTQQGTIGVTDQAWKVVGVGDFNADGRSDILWRNTSTGQDVIWLSGNIATAQTVFGVSLQSWTIVGVGDFNGDGVSDILWRNVSDGRNTIWLSANSATQQGMNTVSGNSWMIVSK